MHVKVKFCILFGKNFIKTGNHVFDGVVNCIRGVCLCHIRKEQSSNCGGFSGDGNVLNVSEKCVGRWRHSD